MSEVVYTCQCGKTYRISSRFAGRVSRCVQCRSEYVVPSPMSSIPVSSDANAPMPVGDNPFTAPVPTTDQELPQNHSVPNEKTRRRYWKPIIAVLILLAIGGIAWPVISESKNRSETAKKFIDERLRSNLPFLEFAKIPVNWTDKPSTFNVVKAFWGNVVSSKSKTTSSASGKFFVETKITEKLYKSVDNEEGLKELGTIELHEKELRIAMEKFQNMPKSFQSELQNIIPKDLSQFQFYTVLAPEGKEITVTGSVELTKEGKESWQEYGTLYDPLFEGNGFTPESQLQNAHKLDAPETKQTVNAIVRSRKDFADAVDSAYDRWKFNEALNSGLRKEVIEKSLNFSEVSTDSINWTSRTPNDALGKFTLKAKTTEKFYKPIDKKVALEKWGITKLNEAKVGELGITEICDKEVYQGDFLSQFKFYEVFLPSDSDVTMTGNIALSKSGEGDGDWQIAKIQADPLQIEDGFIPESKLQDVYKLDDRGTQKAIEDHIKKLLDDLSKLAKQKDDFDRFCRPDAKYEGRFDAFNTHCEVGIVFSGYDVDDPDKVKGTITFFATDKKDNERRSFTVDAPIPGATVTGKIDNTSLPDWDTFVTRHLTRRGVTKKLWEDIPEWKRKELRKSIRNYYDILDQSTEIKIQFSDDKMQFYLHRRPGFAKSEVPAERLVINASTNAQAQNSDDRNWITPIIKKWAANNPAPKPVATVKSKQKPTVETSAGFAGAVDLNEELQKSGFGDSGRSLTNFVQYGSIQLKDRLDVANSKRRSVDKFDDAGIEKSDAEINEARANIKKALAGIAEKTFLGKYTYSVSDDKNRGDGNSSFTMTISPGFDCPTGKEAVFPLSNVTGMTSRVFWRSDISFSVSGSTDSIRELVRNKDNYQVLVWFTNLRYDNEISADVQAIEIIKIGEVPKGPGAIGRQSADVYQPGSNSWQPGQRDRRQPSRQRRAFSREE